jgi:hypothetical protein
MTQEALAAGLTFTKKILGREEMFSVKGRNFGHCERGL